MEAKIKKHNNIWDALGNDTRYFILTGGRGSGKSFEANRFCTLLTFQNNEKVLFTRKTMTSAHISIIPEFEEKIELLGIENQFKILKQEITNVRSGSEILFRGLQASSGDNTANLKSLQGITAWVLDEAEELTDETMFDRIDLSIRRKGKQNRVVLILNPTTKEHWIYKRFFEDKGVKEGFNGVKNDTTYIHTTYLDNINNLSDSFLNQAERIKVRSPEKYKNIMLGGWLDKAEGVIFNNWVLGEFKESGLSVFGQDYGFSIDPTTLVECSIFKDKKEIYVKERFYKQRLSTSEIFDLNKFNAGNSLIIGDSAEPRLISELEAMGNNIEPAIKGQGSITAGISLLQDYKIIVSPDSTNLVKELNNYAWHDKKSSTPIDNHNHIIDALRYAVTKYLDPTPEVFLF